MATSTKKVGLAFAHLNLCSNPFGELSREERVQLAHVDLGTLPEKLTQPRVAVQFLAPAGRGKTTHLLALHAHFVENSFSAPLEPLPSDSTIPYVQLFPGDRPSFGKAPLQFVDSLDLLPKWRRKIFYRKWGSLAFTTHLDLEKELRNAGFSVETRVIGLDATRRCEKSAGKYAEYLFEIFARRIDFSRRGPGPIPLLQIQEVEKLIARFGDDVRAMEAHLYEIFQKLEGVCDVKV